MRKRVRLEEKITEDFSSQEEGSVKRDYDSQSFTSEDLLPSGSTLLNLALSDMPFGGWAKGSLANIVGDSHAGKTMLAWTLFAEVVKCNSLNDYEPIYDEPEASLRINLNRMFGGKLIQRVHIAEIGKDLSSTIEDFASNIKGYIKNGTQFIYVLDSFDALTSKAEEKSTTIGEGTYGTEKAKLGGSILRQIMRDLRNTDSWLGIISQTRQKIGITFGSKKTRSGGDALRFNSTHEVWMHIKEHIKSKNREIGVKVVVQVKKNKLTGKRREVSFPIYYDYGIDDIGSCIDFLLEEGFWRQKAKGVSKIETGGDFKDMTKDKLIEYIEGDNLESQLSEIVGQCWAKIEKDILTKRKPRY
jgi:RecA/RadA recombinase